MTLFKDRTTHNKNMEIKLLYSLFLNPWMRISFSKSTQTGLRARLFKYVSSIP